MRKTFGVLFIVIAAVIFFVALLVFINLSLGGNEERTSEYLGLIVGQLIAFLFITAIAATFGFFGVKWVKAKALQENPVDDPSFSSQWDMSQFEPYRSPNEPSDER